MNPFNAVHRRATMRLAIAGAAALSLVAVTGCGSDDDTSNTTPGTVFDSVAPVDNSSDVVTPAAPGDTTVSGVVPGNTTGGSVAP